MKCANVDYTLAGRALCDAPRDGGRLRWRITLLFILDVANGETLIRLSHVADLEDLFPLDVFLHEDGEPVSIVAIAGQGRANV